MRTDSDTKKKEEVFNSILPEYQPISQAPSSITNIDRFFNCRKDSLSKLEDDFWAKEDEKLYKCLDYKTGDIYLIKNPSLRKRITRDGNFGVLLDVTKKLALTYQEAKKALDSGKRSSSEIDWEGGV